MTKNAIKGLGRAGWFLLGGATALAALMLAGAAMAAFGGAPAQQAGDPEAADGLVRVVPAPPNAPPLPTVFPANFWGPRARKPVDGPSTAGSVIQLQDGAVAGRQVQLPNNVYVKDRWLLGDCAAGMRCPTGGGYELGVLGGKATIVVERNCCRLWDPSIPAEEAGVYDWLYGELGVAKGREILSGPKGQ